MKTLKFHMVTEPARKILSYLKQTIQSWFTSSKQWITSIMGKVTVKSLLGSLKLLAKQSAIKALLIFGNALAAILASGANSLMRVNEKLRLKLEKTENSQV